MKYIATFGAFCLSASVFSFEAHAQSDAYIKDTSADIGVEPYTGSGPVYLSPDIWVRNEPDVNFSPHPFPTAAPTWTPAPHENPEYRDSKTSRPNYVYVRIHNRGAAATTGTERLRLYQAKAGTGLSWPAAWVDNMANACGGDLLHGIEVTKPRENALTVSQTEFNRYVDAVTAISTDTTLQYSDGVQYWQKQQSVHVDPGNPEHGNPSFLPWHREMINRYEERLKEHDPLVKLLYWDWTESLEDLIDRGFIGVSSGSFTFGGVNLSRNVGQQSCTFDTDATLLSATYDDYGAFAPRVENWQRNHDCGHVYIGGNTGSAGQMSSTATATQDPIFFAHHANVDRTWATWQREDADPDLLDPVAVFGANSSNADINSTMSPWDGNTITLPWTGASVTNKTSKDRSVVYPPIYDTAPLNIPVLQPGESVVVEIPWFPPNVNSFNCAGDAGHFCLLARIETETNAPFGMTFPEGTSVGTNTRNNNNIAWKNLTIVDDEIEPLFFISGTSVHNFFIEDVFFNLRLVDRTSKRRFVLNEFADIGLVLPEEILKRVLATKDSIRDMKLTEMKGLKQPVLQITGKNPGLQLVMKPDERFTVQFVVRLRDEKMHKVLLEEPFHFDIEQTLNAPMEFFGVKDRNAREVGGVRFTLDFAQILRNKEKKEEGIRLADFTIILQNDLIEKRADMSKVIETSTHLSPREPVVLTVRNQPDNKLMRSLSVTVDGREMLRDGNKSIEGEILSFRRPGLHRIVVEGISEEGESIRQEQRILVSENIPPSVVITVPSKMAMAKVGETVVITAAATAAFERSVKEMTFHVKEGSSLIGGLNLVRSETYPALERAEGDGPHQFKFVGEKPGMYMLQVGATDDKGIIGGSSHLMIQVVE